MLDLKIRILKSVLKFIFKVLYRVEVSGLENYKKAGKRILIVANHLSFLDGLLFCLFFPGKFLIAVNIFTAERWFFKIIKDLH